MTKIMGFAVSRRMFTAMAASAAASPFFAFNAYGQDKDDRKQSDKTIRVAVSDFSADTLDPAMDGRFPILNHMIQAYDTLLEIGPNGELAPGVAESWGVDDAGLVWTFKLRKGIQFHDDWGELTAADVAFSLRRFMNEKARSPGGSVLGSIVENIEEVDPYTLKLHTKEISMNLTYLLSPHQQETGIIFCKRYLTEKAGDDFEAQSKLIEEQPIGSGPFRFVSRQLGDSYLYEALPSHWRNTPSFKQLELLLVPEAATQMAMLRNGEVDIIAINGDQVEEAEAHGLKIHSVPGALNIWVNFTGTYRPPAEGKPTTNVKVRKALSLAINRNLILQTVLAGYGNLPQTPLNTVPATGDINKDDYVEWAAEIGRYDPDEARRLLTEAGYPDGFSGLQLFTYARPGTPFLPQLGEIIVSQWAQVGVQANIVTMDYGTFREHYVRADLNDATNAGDAAPHSTAARFDALGALTNTWLYEDGVVQLLKDAQLDKDIARAATLTNDAERRALIRDLMNRVNDSWVGLPLFDMDALFAVNPGTVATLDGYPGWPFLGRVFEKIQVA